VTIRYSGRLLSTGTVRWSLLAGNPKRTLVQLGYKTLDGEQIAYFCYPFGGRQVNMTTMPDTDTPAELGMVLPQAGLSELGLVWWWSSVLNVEGKDVDTCP
jgi:hypothetical protein